MQKSSSWFMVAAVLAAVSSLGCADRGKPPEVPKTLTSTIPSVTPADTNVSRWCFSTAETMTCVQSTTLPSGVKKVEMIYIPILPSAR